MTAVMPAVGLTSAEAAHRLSAGLGNEVEQRSGRSLAGIIKANVLSRFIAIVTGLTVVVLVFGSPVDALFAMVMVFNAMIGIVQELPSVEGLARVDLLCVDKTFPFLPRHLSLVAAVTIGVPAFALSFRSSNEPCRPGYLRRVVRFAAPAGVLAATTTFTAYGAARSPLADADLDQARTAATLTPTLTGLWILYRLVRPLNRYTAGLFVLLTAGFGLAVVPSPVSDFYALPLPPPVTTAVILGSLAVTIGLLQLVLSGLNRYLAARGRRPRW